MATSGENVTRYYVDTYCSEAVYPFGFDLICGWEGQAEVDVDRDNTAVFTCGNGHVNTGTWAPFMVEEA